MNHSETSWHEVSFSVLLLISFLEGDVVLGLCLEEPVEVDVAAEDDDAVQEEEGLVQHHDAVDGLGAAVLGVRVHASFGHHHRNIFYVLFCPWPVIQEVHQHQNLQQLVDLEAAPDKPVADQAHGGLMHAVAAGEVHQAQVHHHALLTREHGAILATVVMAFTTSRSKKRGVPVYMTYDLQWMEMAE